MPTLEDMLEAIAILDADQPKTEGRVMIDELACGHLVRVAIDGRSPAVIITDDGESPAEDCCYAALKAKWAPNG